LYFRLFVCIIKLSDIYRTHVYSMYYFSSWISNPQKVCCFFFPTFIFKAHIVERTCVLHSPYYLRSTSMAILGEDPTASSLSAFGALSLATSLRSMSSESVM